MLTTWYTSLVDGAVRRYGDLPQPNNKIAGVSSITEFVKVRGGEFRLGKPDKIRGLKDLPRHTAILNYNYFIGKYTITEKTFSRFNGDYDISEPSIPATSISWFDALDFCNDVSRLNNLPVAYNKHGELLDQYGNTTIDITKVVGYRLPTETEWEYAAIGGISELNFQFSGSNIIDYVGWHKDNSGNHLHEVGELQSNTLGIFDMTGNVNEWCYDSFDYGNPEFFKETINNIGCYTGAYKIVRGGSWADPVGHCAITYRDYCAPHQKYPVIGFRLTRTEV